MKKLFLYLARRDRRGLRILTVFEVDAEIPATRISDLKSLKLPATIESKIISAAKLDRMLWEPWIESAADYTALKKQLESRRYTGISSHSIAEFPIPISANVNMPNNNSKTMMRRKVYPRRT